MSTADLSLRLAQGDERALEECYHVQGPLVRAYLRRFLPDADVDDALQLSFLGLWQARERLDPTQRVEALLFSIARRRAIDTLRRRPQVDVVALRDLMGDDGEDLVGRMAWAAEVRWALSELPAEQRQALELAYFAQLTQREIAERLEAPIGTIKARLSRGVVRMGEILERRSRA
jgi:RNA polymerase sigma factor (sigma-70 family)